MVASELDGLTKMPAGRSPSRKWGPYLSERAWGTVREDYGAGGDAWDFFPHDHARSRAYRWNEDGLAGICDDRQVLCFSLAFWNGADPILKERIYGLTGSEGNHGEDAKEYWFYVDSTPTHSWMRWRYLYPQRAFPYADLLEQNRARSKFQPEYELLDTATFDGDRYGEITADYAKRVTDDIQVSIAVRSKASTTTSSPAPPRSTPPRAAPKPCSGRHQLILLCPPDVPGPVRSWADVVLASPPGCTRHDAARVGCKTCSGTARD